MNRGALRTLLVATAYTCASFAGLFAAVLLGGTAGIAVELPARSWPTGFYLALALGLAFSSIAIALLWTVRRVRSTQPPTIREIVLGSLACGAVAVFVAWLCDRWPGNTSAYFVTLLAVITIGVWATFMGASFVQRWPAKPWP